MTIKLAFLCSFLLIYYPCSMVICLLKKKVCKFVPLCTKISLSQSHSRSEKGGKKEFNIFSNSFLWIYFQSVIKLWKVKVEGKCGGFAKFHRLLIIPSFSFLANASIWIVGSDPMDRKHIRGVRVSLSSQVFSRFKITGSVYFSSKESAIYFLAWKTVRSGHQDLEMNMSYRKKFNLFILYSI